VIRHSKATAPQREFWSSPARFRLYVGGVGAGKTRAGCVEAFRQPANSVGAVVAPTYGMLRDATALTFLELARRGKILRGFNKQDMTATLAGNRTVLFRSADRPDRLRGPNLSWFWLDEAAMMPEAVWLIMMGRRRVAPGLAWLTTTPRGKDWIHRRFVADRRAGYATVRASSRSNPYLPADFVQSLVDAYDDQFRAQEVEGEFLDDTLGRLVPDWWIDRLPSLIRPAKRAGPPALGADLGEGTGRDSTVILVGDALGILHGEESPWVGPAQAAARIAELRQIWGIPEARIGYDAGGGRGLDLSPYLEQHGITEAYGYKGSRSGGAKFANKRSRVAWKLRQRLDPERPKPPPPLRHDEKRSVFDPDPVALHLPQEPFCLPAEKPWWPLLAEELKALKYHHKGKLIALEPKEELQKALGRSPNVVDALLILTDMLGDDE
jgi:hypothetical protein